MADSSILCSVRYGVSGKMCGEPAVYAYENCLHPEGSRYRYHFCCETHRKDECSRFDWEIPLSVAIVNQVMGA